jgi:hypothetical protein
MNTASLAKAVNRNGRGMTSAMRALERQGMVVKNGQGKGVTWSLPRRQRKPLKNQQRQLTSSNRST